MFKIRSISASTLPKVLARFPVPAALMAMFTATMIVREPATAFQEDYLLLIGLVISAYLCVSMVLAGESRGIKTRWYWQIAISVVVTLGAIYSEILLLNIAMALGAALLLLGNAVRHSRLANNLHVWDFTHKIWTAAIFATIASIIYFVGINMIQMALVSLFGIDIRAVGNNLLLPFGLALLAPLYWLSSIPAVDEDTSHLQQQPEFISRAIAFIGSWILAPLMLIYAVILLAYCIKIITQNELPNGEVAALTLPFVLLGTLTWLVLEAPFAQELKVAAVFRQIWFPVSLPVAILLASAIWVRISAYGLTTERIALLLATLWAILLALWFSFASNKWRDIRIIPGLASALLAIGAVCAGQFSYSSQYARAISNMQLSGILDDGGLVKPIETISITNEAAARRSKSALQYLLQSDQIKTLEKLQQINPDNAPIASGHEELMQRLKLSDLKETYRDGLQAFQFSAKNQSFQLHNYEKLLGPFRLNSQTDATDTPYENTRHQLTQNLRINMSGHDLILTTGDSVLTSFNLREWTLQQTNLNDQLVLPDNLVIPFYNANGQSISIVIHDFYFTDDSVYTHINATIYLLASGL